MPSVTIKRIPDDLLARLKLQAQAHRRSLNSEILVCLEHASSEPVVDAVEWLAGVDRLRDNLALTPLTDAGLRAAKRGGRP